MMTEQTKNAIKAMLESGFNRSDFSARVERIYQGKHPETGKAMYAYGNVEVDMKCHKDITIANAEAMADNGLHVIIPKKSDGTLSWPLVKYNGRSGVWLWDNDGMKLVYPKGESNRCFSHKL